MPTLSPMPFRDTPPDLGAPYLSQQGYPATQNPSLAPNIQTDRGLFFELGSSSTKSPDEVSSIDGVDKLSSQLIDEFDTEFDIDSYSTVAAVDPSFVAGVAGVRVINAPHTPHTQPNVLSAVEQVSVG